VISREELYQLVWSMPMVKVAEQHEVSGSYLARICTLLNVPRPGPGYWAKLAVGKARLPELLPEARPGDLLHWSKDEQLPPVPRPKLPPRRSPRARAVVVQSRTHRLIQGAKGHFENTRQVDEGSYLKPFKKLLVDITASQTGLEKALPFANSLFNALEAAGHRVVLAPSTEAFTRPSIDEREVRTKRNHQNYSGLWSPYRPTVVYIGTVGIGLAIVEMSEQVLLRYIDGKYVREADYVPRKGYRYHDAHTWTTTRDVPCGRLRLVAFSPYRTASWSAEWHETKGASLDRTIPSVLRSLEAATAEIVAKLEEAERRAEIARQECLVAEEKRRREADRRCVMQSIRDSDAQLRQVIQQWTDITAVETFLAGVEQRARDLSGDDRKLVLERLALARQLLGNQDPLAAFRTWRAPQERYQSIYPGVSDPAGGTMTGSQRASITVEC
jgi:hypothetical protein